jgi:ubiquinone biosynthesis protein COQ4
MAIDWRAARIELLNLRDDPENTEAGARLFRALGGESNEGWILARMRRSESGRRLLRERPDLLGVLANRGRLRALPDGSLGREYARFAEREQIFPEDLRAMMVRVEGGAGDGEVAFVRTRGTALHDLLHVLTGYGRDAAGEIALLAFTAAQERNRTLNWLSLLGCAKALVRGRLDVVRLRRAARRRARRSAWMLEQDWAALVERPIDEVRRELGLWPVPEYRPWSSQDAVR